MSDLHPGQKKILDAVSSAVKAHEDKDIRIAALQSRIAELEAKLDPPPDGFPSWIELEAKLAAVADEKLIESLDRWWHLENEELPALRAAAERLAKELDNMTLQHGCICGHPACNRCEDTREAKDALTAYQSQTRKEQDDEQ